MLGACVSAIGTLSSFVVVVIVIVIFLSSGHGFRIAVGIGHEDQETVIKEITETLEGNAVKTEERCQCFVAFDHAGMVWRKRRISALFTTATAASH